MKRALDRWLLARNRAGATRKTRTVWVFASNRLRYNHFMGNVVTRDPEVLGGEPVFAGTRVPIKSLFEHLEAGDSIADFLEGFPSVKRDQVLALLEESKAHAMAQQ
jgi:uncharacterized protein (DUF433 family)